MNPTPPVPSRRHRVELRQTAAFTSESWAPRDPNDPKKVRFQLNLLWDQPAPEFGDESVPPRPATRRAPSPR